MWNVLYYEFGKCDMVFCCDRRPTIKQEMCPSYKANREHNHEVSKSKDVCEYILSDCGFTVLSAEGYEADDFIYSLVMEHKKSYDHIYIYTGDSDMYFLVDENVSIEPSSSRAKTVNRQNYTYTVRKDEFTPYNTSTFYKILFGDTSDGITGLPKDLALKLKEVIDTPVYRNLLGDKETVLQLLGMFGKEASDQGSLVFPLDIRVPQDFAQGDKLRVAEWGNAFRNKMWRTGGDIPYRVQQCIEEMVNLGMASDN